MLWLLASALAAEPWAIVATDAPLYAHAGDAAPVGAVGERLGALWQVASTQDGWVQLRTRVAPSHLCAVGATAEGEADLTVWTPLTSLQRAVTRAVVVAPKAGLELTVRAGWIPGESPFDAWVVSKLPSSALGATFSLDTSQATPPSGVFRRDWDGKIRADNAELLVPIGRVGAAGLVGADRVAVELDGRCVALTAPAVNVPPARLTSDGPPAIGGLGGKARVDQPDDLRPEVGAPLWWSDGTPAGSSGVGLVLHGVTAAGELRCGAWTPWTLSTASVQLCVR